MRSNISDYDAVVEAATKFTRSVAEGNSKYAKELFTEDACLFGFLNGKLERGSIDQFYHNVDTVGAGNDFKTRIDVLELEETVSGSVWPKPTIRIQAPLSNQRVENSKQNLPYKVILCKNCHWYAIFLLILHTIKDFLYRQ